MKARAFAYRRPESIEDAVGLLAQYGDEARVLAGGQSLMPMMNLRLASPQMVVDINRIAELRGVDRRPGEPGIRIGALVRHAEAARSDILHDAVPLIGLAMPHIAHPAIRNRGTVCGSLALADPAAELPACAIVLRATLVLSSVAGTREVPAERFFRGLFDTDRHADEMIVALRIPPTPADQVCGFDEFVRRRGDWAMVGVAATASRADGVLRGLRLVVFGTEPAPFLSRAAARFVEGEASTVALARQVGEAVAAEIPAENCLAEFVPARRRQAAYVVSQVLEQMVADHV
jgi:carbon-monoxide dehydrogenase medium subunit